MSTRRSFIRNSLGSAAFFGAVPILGPDATGRHRRRFDESICHIGKTELSDSLTGRVFWQMTTGHCNSWVPYMYNAAFTNDERYFVFSSDRTGRPQLYRMDIESGESTQLTFFEDYSGRPVMERRFAREVYFLAGGGRVWAVDVATGYTRQVTDLGDRARQIRGMTVSWDGTTVLVAYISAETGRSAVALADSSGGPAEEVFVFDDHPKRGRIERVSHPQFNPADKNLISIVLLPDMQGGFPHGLEPMDLPPEMRARAWTVNLASGDAQPFLVMEPGFRATHEYWAPDGKGMYYHKKRWRGWFPASIEWIPTEGGGPRVIIESNDIRLGHSNVTLDQSKIVSDDQTSNRNQLLLIDARDGSYEVLLWPNTTGDAQINHVHPSFSPTGRYILYTSDQSGYSQVYLIDLDGAS